MQRFEWRFRFSLWSRFGLFAAEIHEAISLSIATSQLNGARHDTRESLMDSNEKRANFSGSKNVAPRGELRSMTLHRRSSAEELIEN
jgi:hypothetical protein